MPPSPNGRHRAWRERLRRWWPGDSEKNRPLWRTGAFLSKGSPPPEALALSAVADQGDSGQSAALATRRLLSKKLRLGKESPLASEGSRPAPREPAAAPSARGEALSAMGAGRWNEQRYHGRLCRRLRKSYRLGSRRLPLTEPRMQEWYRDVALTEPRMQILTAAGWPEQCLRG